MPNVDAAFPALLAGGVAGTTVDLVLFPLDTIKTRLVTIFKDSNLGLDFGSRVGSEIFIRAFHLSLLGHLHRQPCSLLHMKA